MRFQRHISLGGIITNKNWFIIVGICALVIFSPVSPQYSIARQFYPVADSDVMCMDNPICQAINMTLISKKLPELSSKQFEVKKTFWTTVTAYSSSPDETSGDPFVTASGDRTTSGVLAHQYLPFGTKVRFPEVFGDKIFVVKDRLHEKHTSEFLFDMWVHSKAEAKAWGAKILKVEVLK